MTVHLRGGGRGRREDSREHVKAGKIDCACSHTRPFSPSLCSVQCSVDKQQTTSLHAQMQHEYTNEVGLLSWLRHVRYTVCPIPAWICKSCRRFDCVVPVFFRAKVTSPTTSPNLLHPEEDRSNTVETSATLSYPRWCWSNSISNNNILQ